MSGDTVYNHKTSLGEEPSTGRRFSDPTSPLLEVLILSPKVLIRSSSTLVHEGSQHCAWVLRDYIWTLS